MILVCANNISHVQQPYCESNNINIGNFLFARSVSELENNKEILYKMCKIRENKKQQM